MTQPATSSSQPTAEPPKPTVWVRSRPLGWFWGRSPHALRRWVRRFWLPLLLGLGVLLGALGLHSLGNPSVWNPLALHVGRLPWSESQTGQTVMQGAEGAIALSTSANPARDLTEDRDEGRAPRPLPRYGHFAFAEADPADLMVVASYSQDVAQRFEQLHTDAGLALLKMIDAARLDGVWIVPVSGFRDYERQTRLFRLKTQQYGSAEAAARAVAPPGHSEHHTGYAVDLSDGLARAMDISEAFGKTAAYAWLTRRAAEFGFELSFPENNPQGVNYEPWHWRYVGTPEARQLFEPLAESIKFVE
ncbi:D-alanyl-D-alanine carboxypeptidase family protein [Leptolyngbya sp. O-77]|uniref:M15 family metallopeptidase n=1 Tax=Leptolyngbya sp. O-77 TaxID=1080068 RepID=UPI00074D46F9|nr:M15 family metallopeptidase [Leptolyngbya sp. O-77]BAU41523.1 D-alanyl-D-alanine carboxypeptidase [Leptolyngbya sp. O-77]